MSVRPVSWLICPDLYSSTKRFPKSTFVDGCAGGLGQEASDQRERLNIPLLPDNWQANQNFYDDEKIIWRNPNEDFQNCYYSKLIKLKEGAITSDNTSFVSKVKYTVNESDDYASIALKYCFLKEDTSSKLGMTCLYYYDAITHYFPKTITRDEADSIIKGWLGGNPSK